MFRGSNLSSYKALRLKDAFRAPGPVIVPQEIRRRILEEIAIVVISIKTDVESIVGSCARLWLFG